MASRRLKELSKEVLAAASESVDDDVARTDAQLLALLVAEAMALLDAADGSIEGLDDDSRRDMKRVRKLLRRHALSTSAANAPPGTSTASASASRTTEKATEGAPLELGQYSTAGGGMGDKTLAKFARLMGGAKHGGNVAEATHTTFAASAEDEARRQAALQAQFEAAAARKGKLKGLGK